MLFNSFQFCCVFFPLVTALYFLVPHAWRRWLLLGASCWFYMAFVPVYILILALTIAVDYFAGIWIEQHTGRRKKFLLVASIIANVGVLAVFKYWNFLNQNIGDLYHAFGLGYSVPDLGMLLPIGLSFHTFQSLAYTIEVYRGHQRAERRIGTFALYVLFYPQLVAGPIERPANLLDQLNAPAGRGIRSPYDHARVVHGLKQMLWGFFKKLVIADRCGVVVDQVYGNPGDYEAVGLLLATYLFAFQIYCDFSGYTDIALGAARIMGFDLMQNFRTPYRSASISEFWQRWHISLSTWFRDYLYIPLGGNRLGRLRWYTNLLIVFLVSGLWHGANWTYVIWGGLHGSYLVLARVFAPLRERIDAATGLARAPWLERAINVFITFHLALLAWVFFRANSVADAFTILRRIATTAWHRADLSQLLKELPTSSVDITLLLVLLFVLIDPWMDAVIKRERRMPHGLQGMVLFAVLLVGLLVLGHFGATSFIYFQF